MIRSLQALLRSAPAGALQQLESSTAWGARGFASRAVAGQESSITDALVQGNNSEQQGVNASAPAQVQQRGMSYQYARKVEGKSFIAHDHTAKFGYGLLTDYLIKTVPKFITMATVGPAQSTVLPQYQEPTIYTTPEHLVPLMYFLRDHVNTQFKCLLDVTAVDYPERKTRFEVVYHLLSPKWNNRIRVKVPVDELTPVPTVVPVWNSANWFERETWDMFGVFFTGHPDLRRILTDYGFNGHPLRKDFPMSGYVEMRYDYSKKRVVYEPLELTQEFRYFDFSSPWETLQR